MAYKVVKKISDKGFPVHTPSGNVSERWRKSHAAANKKALEVHGATKAKAVARLVKKTPKGELLGSHTKSGKIIISSRVPKSLRPVIATHEREESRLMRMKRRK